jgi:hypothetical protein
MSQHTPNGWLAGDVSNEFYGSGIKARRYRDRLVLFRRNYRIELYISFKDLATGGVNASNCRSELRVRIGCYVFREKIDKASISL